MAFVISDACVDVRDASCVAACPVDCIHYEEGVDRKLYIDPVECIDCAACVSECPVAAIYPEWELPEDQKECLEIDALWFQEDGREEARKRVEARRPPGSPPVVKPGERPERTASMWNEASGGFAGGVATFGTPSHEDSE